MRTIYSRLSEYIKHEDDCPLETHRQRCECGATVDREHLLKLINASSAAASKMPWDYETVSNSKTDALRDALMDY